MQRTSSVYIQTARKFIDPSLFSPGRFFSYSSRKGAFTSGRRTAPCRCRVMTGHSFHPGFGWSSTLLSFSLACFECAHYDNIFHPSRIFDGNLQLPAIHRSRYTHYRCTWSRKGHFATVVDRLSEKRGSPFATALEIYVRVDSEPRV